MDLQSTGKYSPTFLLTALEGVAAVGSKLGEEREQVGRLAGEDVHYLVAFVEMEESYGV